MKPEGLKCAIGSLGLVKRPRSNPAAIRWRPEAQRRPGASPSRHHTVVARPGKRDQQQSAEDTVDAARRLDGATHRPRHGRWRLKGLRKAGLVAPCAAVGLRRRSARTLSRPLTPTACSGPALTMATTHRSTRFPSVA